MQLHTHDTSSCGPEGRLIISPADMKDIFVTSCAELPGLLVAAVLADLLGRKGCDYTLTTLCYNLGAQIGAPAFAAANDLDSRAAADGATTSSKPARLIA